MTKDTISKIEIRAYEIWEREGRPEGKATEHWDRAIAEITREEAEAAVAKMKKPSTRKKAASGKKAEKTKPTTRAKKTENASTAKKEPKGQTRKAPATPAVAVGKKPKKRAK